MNRRTVACTLGFLFLASVAAAQGVTAEADITAGRSTEGVNAAGTQLRLFGAVAHEWRMWAEVTWAGNFRNRKSDAFGAAYPYDRAVRPMEVFVERALPKVERLATIRIGRYRDPFGISGRSDHAYGGFTRAPLIRYGTNWAISNTFMTTGVDALIGRPELSVEASVGASQDEGQARRPDALNIVVRAQGYWRSAIVGVSHMRSRPSMKGSYVHGPMVFTGIDGRWMRGGVQLRGEWVDGRPFNGVATRGGYLDLIVHRAGMGPLTLVGRVEKLDYDAGPFSAYYHRLVVGGRYQATRAIGTQINVLHQPAGLTDGHRNALDASITYTVRF
jgi:hypothetical protein